MLAATPLGERLFGSTIAAFELLGVYIGDRLGLYRALAHGPLSAPGLAERAGIAPRYAREWLEHQAVAGILEVEDMAAPADERTLRAAGGARRGAARRVQSRLRRAVRSAARRLHASDPRAAGGVPQRRGRSVRRRRCRSVRGPGTVHEADVRAAARAGSRIPAAEELHRRLQADPPARVADVACGLGHSSVAIARGYPKVEVDGVDLDEASIARARELHAGNDVEDRVGFRHADAADPGLAGRYDLVTVFESLHDMSDPVGVLRAVRGMLADGGRVLIGDELTADAFSPDAGDLERLYYGFSVLHCLPVGMVGDDPAGTGTVMRADTVRRYAGEAGFAAVDVLPIEHDFWRFYELKP